MKLQSASEQLDNGGQALGLVNGKAAGDLSFQPLPELPRILPADLQQMMSERDPFASFQNLWAPKDGYRYPEWNPIIS